MKLINLKCPYCGVDFLHPVDETPKTDLLHLADETLEADLSRITGEFCRGKVREHKEQEKTRRETMEDDNGITIDTVEQELLNDIDLTTTAADPDLEDLQRTQTAVSTYKIFQEALCIREEREAYN